MPRATAAPTLDQLSPMLLVERKTIPRQDGWLYEIKYDGYRVLASTGSGAQLKSRGGIDATRWFPEVAAALTGLDTGSARRRGVRAGRGGEERLQQGACAGASHELV